jgi:rhamnogalacturonyl hydrolase YesR
MPDRLRIAIVFALIGLVTGGRSAAQGRPTPETQRESVLRVMTAAADWQLAHPSDHAPDDWTQAAFYTGVMALAGVTDNPKYADAMRAMGALNRWRPGPRPGHADDYAVIATYAQLFQIDKDRRQLAPALALFNFLASRKYDEPLTWGNSIETRELAWCDALFMGPPAMAAVSAATGDRKYLDLADRLWWKTTDDLYDKDEHLYFRDSRYFEQREKNGKKVFWSRGNGWVFAGLARMLQDMPQDYPARARYVTLYREMAGTVAALQGSDGYWRSSLLDPDSRPNPETSGTGFFTYGLAWGINQGILPRDTYEPQARRGWDAMVKAVHPDGMLGWVQPIGAEPGATTAETTEVYGVGALLLAGSEVLTMAAPRLPDAERALRLGPFSVTQKSRVAPSGDKHDFLTLAPYWWPDPTKPGGLPYIRRDGEVNPESKRETDDTPFAQMSSTVKTLVAAFREAHDERFAARAALLLRVWFLDPATRMNPNLDYGQGVPGRNTGRGEGIIATRKLVDVVEAARVLEASPSWTAHDREALQAWCAAFATWLRTSKNGREEAAAANNHGTWYEAQLTALLLYTGKTADAKAGIEKAKARLASQVEPDGRQPLELARTRAWSYSVMNLKGWFTLARLAQPSGADLWNYRTRDGRSLRAALDYLVPFAGGRAPWPHAQITAFEWNAFADLLEQAAAAWNVESYRVLANKLRGAGGEVNQRQPPSNGDPAQDLQEKGRRGGLF